jgi:hypothetical protein
MIYHSVVILLFIGIYTEKMHWKGNVTCCICMHRRTYLNKVVILLRASQHATVCTVFPRMHNTRRGSTCVPDRIIRAQQASSIHCENVE